MAHQLITLMIVLPCLGAIGQAVLASPGTTLGNLGFGKWVAFATSVLASLCAVISVSMLNPEAGASSATSGVAWLRSYAVSYEMGFDGLNALAAILIAVIFPILILFEWNRQKGARGVHGLFLLLQASLFGAVCSQDLFLIFFFWAISALPFYFLIAIWGGSEREAAATQKIVVSSIGNGLVFLVLVLVYYSVQPQTFSVRELLGGKMEGKTLEFLGHELSLSKLSFSLLCAGFACRIPVWPLHGWFSGMSTQAPPSVMVAFSGVFVPITLSIFMRLVFSLFPKEFTQYSDIVIWVGAINVLFGAAGAIAQRGLQMVLGFFCIALVGLTLIGMGSLDPTSVVGSVYLGLAGGLGLAGFGILVGAIRERIGHSEFLNEKDEPVLGGLVSRAPLMAFIAGAFAASLLGFPGLGGFVGHALIMMGSYGVYPYAVLAASVSLLLLTYALFTVYRHVFLGKAMDDKGKFADLTVMERSYLMPVVAALFAFGIYPKPFLDLVKPTVLSLLTLMK